MADHDAFTQRGHALEEQYFQKKERELIEKIRRAAEAERQRGRLGERTGLTDPSLLQDLQDMGFTPETVRLLPLVPLIEIAWAEGGVMPPERFLVEKFARSLGIEPHSAADRQMEAWMTKRPAPVVFNRAARVIKALIAAGSEVVPGDLTADALVDYCEQIATATGGILGMGRVSLDERETLSRIAAAFRGRRE